MTKKKNQGSKINKKEKESLADIVRFEMIGKQQIPGRLKDGDNFCISGLLISHFAPDINIEGQSWSGITELVNRYPKYFSEETYSSGSYYGNDAIQKFVYDFKQYYKGTKRINLRLLASINDHSFGSFKPFTFEDFADLFQEIGIKIEKLNPLITNYKEDNVLSIDNVQLIEDKPITSLDPPIMSNSPFIGSPNIIIQNMNVNLEPDVLNNMVSKYVAEMLSMGRITGETTRPFKNIIKTEHKNE